MKTNFWYRYLLILCFSVWVNSAFSVEKIVKYPPMTVHEVQTVISKAAGWFELMIKEGKEQQALEILSKPPRFRLSKRAWKELAKILTPSALNSISSLKGHEFAETKNLIPLLKDDKIPNYWDVSKIILQHADEVFSTDWNKGSIMDYRLVIAYNCEKKTHVTHAFFPQIQNLKTTFLKSTTGRYYVFEVCNKLLEGDVDSWWIYAPTVNPFNLPSNMHIYMKQVKDSPYQVGTVIRHINLSEQELNKKYR